MFLYNVYWGFYIIYNVFTILSAVNEIFVWDVAIVNS